MHHLELLRQAGMPPASQCLPAWHLDFLRTTSLRCGAGTTAVLATLSLALIFSVRLTNAHWCQMVRPSPMHSSRYDQSGSVLLAVQRSACYLQTR